MNEFIKNNDTQTPTMVNESPTGLADRTVPNSPTSGDISRRSILKTTAAATTTLIGVSAATTVAAQETTFELGGETPGWQGESPSSIGGQTNPTLELEAGTEYEIIWENLDGAPHNVVIEDDSGNQFVRTELINEQGATQSVTFTAEAGMSTYYCEAHPQSMRGSVSVSGSEPTSTATPTETETETDTETSTETETPTETETAETTSTPATETEAENKSNTATETDTESDADDGPMMADEACPNSESASASNDTCEDHESGGQASNSGGDNGPLSDDELDQLLQLLMRFLRQLFAGA